MQIQKINTSTYSSIILDFPHIRVNAILLASIIVTSTVRVSIILAKKIKFIENI